MHYKNKKNPGLFMLLGLPILAASLSASAQLNNNPAIQLPYMGEPADRYLSPAQEKKLGTEFYRNLYRMGAILDDAELQHYIQHVGYTLVNKLDSKDQQYTFFIVNDNSINAFAVPGGYIGINSGLILASQNEDQLAGVLAHEIAHVSQRHIARQIADSTSKSAPSLAAVLAGILLAVGGNGDAGTALIYAGTAASAQQQINFTRTHEIEADRIGFSILQKSHYDPRGMVELFEILQRSKPSFDQRFSFLLTHPLDNVRISEAENRIAALPPIERKPPSQTYPLMKNRLRALTGRDSQQWVYELEKSLDKKSRDTDSVKHYAYSQALESNRNHEQAIEQLLPLTKVDPNNIHYQLALARNYQKLGRHAQAVEILAPLSDLYPDHYPIVLHYANALKENHRPEICIAALRHFQQHYTSDSAMYFHLLAECYNVAGKEVQAKINLGEYYIRTGNYNAAFFQLNAALDERNIDDISRSQIRERLRDLDKLVKEKEGR